MTLMKVVRDDAAYDPLQRGFLQYFVEAVYAEIKFQSGLEGERLRDTVSAACFSVANSLDGDPGFEVDGNHYYPILAFTKHEDQDTAIMPKGNSYMHEYAINCVDHVIAQNAKP